MNKTLKWIGVTIAGFVTIMILVVIGVNIFVPEEELLRVKKQAEANAARKQYLKDSTEKAQARMDSLTAVETEKIELQGMDDEIEESTHVSLGESGVIKMTTPGCLRKADFEEVLKLAGVNDRLGIDQMEKDGIVTPLFPGIKGKKIDAGFGWEQIRITEGELKGLAFYTFGGSLER